MVTKVKRPIPVWIIVVFFTLIALLQLALFVTSALGGEISVQVIATGIASLVSVMAVITTWRLRVSALYWFVAMFVVGLSHYTGLTSDQPPTMGALDIFNWITLLLVIACLWFLKHRGLLK